MKIFIVTGRLGENLVHYKSMPVAAIDSVTHVYVFTVHRCLPAEKITFITLPKWIFSVRPVWVGRALRHFYELLQLIFYTIKYRPDIINGVYTFPKGFNSVWISKLLNIKSIVSVLGSKGEMNPFVFPKRILKHLKWWVVRNADAIATKGERDNQYFISEGLDPKKIFTFNGCIDLQRFTRDDDNQRNIDVVFVGSIYELKGPGRIVEVVAEISKHINQLRVFMIGDGVDLDQTKLKARALGLENVIAFPGYVKDVAPFYKRAKIMILMSRSEGNPNCMLEAMACGCVPVVPDVGNISETISNKKNGILVESCYDINTYAREIFNLLTNDDLRVKIAQNAIDTVRQKFSIQSQAAGFKKIIDYVLQ